MPVVEVKLWEAVVTHPTGGTDRSPHLVPAQCTHSDLDSTAAHKEEKNKGRGSYSNYTYVAVLADWRVGVNSDDRKKTWPSLQIVVLCTFTELSYNRVS
jgi:hypothetical protein